MTTLRVSFDVEAKGKRRVESSTPTATNNSSGSAASSPMRRAPADTPSRSLRRMLATAHAVDRLIARGEITDHVEAARLLGITKARVGQLLRLCLLAPSIQERLLLDELDLAERDLRELHRLLDFRAQERAFDRIVEERAARAVRRSAVAERQEPEGLEIEPT